MSSFAAGESVSPRPLARGGHPFRLGVRRDGTTLDLRLTGMFDWRCVGRVEAALERFAGEQTRRVVFDLRALGSLDMAGLRTLLRANERARTERFEVIVVRPTGSVNRIFTLTRAGEELTFVDSAPEGNGTG